MKNLAISTFGRMLGNLRETIKAGEGNKIALMIAISILSFFQTTAQSIKIEVDDKGNGVNLTINADTIAITKIDTVFVDKPYEVVVRDTIYQDKIVEVPVEVIVRDTILRDYKYSEMKELVDLWAEADTIQAHSDIIQLDYTNAGVKPTTKPTIYTFVYGIGIVPVQMDSIYGWQRKFNLERVKTLANTRYRSLDLPFQFRTHRKADITSNSVSLYFRTTEKPTYIQVLKDGVVYKTFDNPKSDKISEIEWEFMFGVTGLEPRTSYEIDVIIRNAKGEEDRTKDVWINTL